MAEALSQTRSQVHVVLKSKVRNDRLLRRLQGLDHVTVHEAGPGAVELWAGQPAELSPEAAARRLAEVDATVGARAIVVRGRAVCRQVAEDPELAPRLWAYVTDLPYPLEHATTHAVSELGFVAERARRMFAQTEDARAYLEAVVPAAAGKTILLNPMIPDEFFVDLDAEPPVDLSGRPLELVYAGKFAKDWRTLEMCTLAEAFGDGDHGVTVRMIGDKFQRAKDDPQWIPRMREALGGPSVDWLGGMSREETLENVRRADIGLGWRSPELDASLEVSTKALEYAAVGTPPLLNRTAAHAALLGEDYPFLLEEDSVQEVVRVLGRAPEVLEHARRRAQDAVRWYALSESARRLEGHFAAAESRRRRPGAEPVRVLIAGHDLKFAGELIEMLQADAGIELLFDEWPSLHEHDEQHSTEMVARADVVLCEWAGRNAVWYSRHKRRGQRLLVRLHGFEVRAPWLQDIDFGAVDALLTVSTLMVGRVVEATGWDAAKVHVIPNAVDTRDLSRPKLPGASRRLGLVGMVPFLKRPDRALDALEAVLDQDPRFTLHLRGRLPWEYPHVWKKPAEQEAYLAFFDRIGRSDRLRDAVVFEPFGPDMGSWLRKVGFVLSPSSDESFHLAPAEGMASGAFPIVWDRPGSADVFGEDLVVRDAAAAAEQILAVAQPEVFEAQSTAMRQRAVQWDLRTVNDRWMEFLLEGAEA
ncbi:glycosyltransferase [Citricoccus sp. SGAir0253]|nr:glycosyltransferase [Citricoccus sp. SGAir0253]